MPPTVKKWGAYWFCLVYSCVRVSVCPFKKNLNKARNLKFHIRIPHQKIAYLNFHASLKGPSAILLSKISRKLLKVGASNLGS